MSVHALAEAFRDCASDRDRRRLPKLPDLCRMIRGYEAGEHVPGERYRMLYAAVFGISEEVLFSDEEDAPVSGWRTPSVDLNGRFTPDDEERLTLAVQRPSRVDTEVIDALSTILAGQRRLEDAIGPSALLGPVTMQTSSVTAVLRDASGPYRDQLARLAAEWITFTGWLHAATRQDVRALTLFGQAENLAQDVGDGAAAGLATSFRGYVARQQGRPQGVIRAACAAAATPGVHRTQMTFDRLQAAQGFASLGEKETVRRLLDEAAELAQDAGEPPPAVYWYTESFFKLNIGMALLGIGEYRDAVDMLGSGLEGMPADQRGAQWIREYMQALADAKERA